MLQNLRNQSDKDLLLRIERHPEPEVIGVLLERYSHLISALCLSYIRDTETLTYAIKQILQQLTIDLQNHPIDHFNTWVYRVTVEQCRLITAGKSSVENKPRPETERSFPAGSLKIQPTDTSALAEAFRRLPDEDRQCLMDFYLERKPLAAVARQEGLTAPEALEKIRYCKQHFLNTLSSA